MHPLLRYDPHALEGGIQLIKLEYFEAEFSCDLVPSKHKWLHFIDTIQYVGDGKDVTICKNDIVVNVKDIKADSLTIIMLKKMKDISTILFLKRPYVQFERFGTKRTEVQINPRFVLKHRYGRPNRTPAHERGWLYAERITVAIRTAAAEAAMFDDVVVSNNKDLVKQLFLWSRELRKAAEMEEKNKGSISRQLNCFQSILAKMKFTVPDNDKLVNGIITDLVRKFETNWKEESRRQIDMSARAREILLRWGCFSEQYVERAGFLESDHFSYFRIKTICRLFFMGVIAPVIGALPFSFEVTSDPSEDVAIGSLWYGVVSSMIPLLLGTSLRHDFARVPFGFHNILQFVLLVLDHGSISCTCNML